MLAFFLVNYLENLSKLDRIKAHNHVMNLAYQERQNCINLYRDENGAAVKVLDKVIASAPSLPESGRIRDLITDPYLERCDYFIEKLSENKLGESNKKVNPFDYKLN